MSKVKEKNVEFNSNEVYFLDRGFQLWNPFHSIWSTPIGRNISLIFLILAGVSSFIYIICLIILVIRVFWNIRGKQGELAAMRRIRRLMYQVGSIKKAKNKYFIFLYLKGAFYRFQFLLLSTILCAIMTIIWYFLSQMYETHWVWDTEKRPTIHYSGAFITGKK